MLVNSIFRRGNLPSFGHLPLDHRLKLFNDDVVVRHQSFFKHDELL